MSGLASETGKSRVLAWGMGSVVIVALAAIIAGAVSLVVGGESPPTTQSRVIARVIVPAPFGVGVGG